MLHIYTYINIYIYIIYIYIYINIYTYIYIHRLCIRSPWEHWEWKEFDSASASAAASSAAASSFLLKKGLNLCISHSAVLHPEDQVGSWGMRTHPTH